MEKLIRRIDLTRARGEDARQLLRREWLATNGLGGYASGTISGSVTWRYHGLLIAALPAPFGRMVMLNHLAEYIRFADDRVVEIGGEERSRPQEAEQIGHFITEFRLENHLPVWRYEVEGIVLEKHVVFLYGQNTVHISYRLLSSQENVWLELRPSMHFRGHDKAVNDKTHDTYRFSVTGEQYEVMTNDSVPPL
jgi:predicted glycogen debranching enzyme